MSSVPSDVPLIGVSDGDDVDSVGVGSALPVGVGVTLTVLLGVAVDDALLVARVGDVLVVGQSVDDGEALAALVLSLLVLSLLALSFAALELALAEAVALAVAEPLPVSLALAVLLPVSLALGVLVALAEPEVLGDGVTVPADVGFGEVSSCALGDDVEVGVGAHVGVLDEPAPIGVAPPPLRLLPAETVPDLPPPDVPGAPLFCEVRPTLWLS